MGIVWKILDMPAEEAALEFCKPSFRKAQLLFWLAAHGTSFRCMQGMRVVVPRRHPPRFQKKSWEAKQCASERTLCKAMRVKPKVKSCSQVVGKARNVKLLRKATSGEQRRPRKRATRDSVTKSAVVVEQSKPFGVYMLKCCPGCWM